LGKRKNGSQGDDKFILGDPILKFRGGETLEGGRADVGIAHALSDPSSTKKVNHESVWKAFSDDE